MEIEKGASGEEKGAEAGELGALEAPEQRAVIAAQIFEEEAQHGVEHDVQAEDRALGVAEAGEPEQENENEDVSLTLPYLSRPQGLCAVGTEGERGVRVEEPEVRAGRMAEGIAVHKIGNAAHRLSENDGRRHGICEMKDRDMIAPQINIRGNKGKDQTALNGHAALPYEGNFKQVIVVIVPVKKEHVPQPSAENARKGNGEPQIKNVLFPAAAVFFQKKVGSDASGQNAQ